MGIYVASEATMYRLLREEKLLAHRGRAKPPTRRRPDEYVAAGPNQVWCWDITYLRSPIAGEFYYLYLFLDAWSRMIVGWAVLEGECNKKAAKLFVDICDEQELNPKDLVLHSDNGRPMKGATMLATMRKLGVVTSFSRPHVSDDNAFAEAIFRTAKYRPGFPDGPFESIEAAREWVSRFVAWYNHEHQHSAIRFVTPAQRHAGLDTEILAHREVVYERAKKAHLERWTGATRNWEPIATVRLNPRRDGTTRIEESKAA
jgi:transposase InsO family protein